MYNTIICNSSTRGSQIQSTISNFATHSLRMVLTKSNFVECTFHHLSIPESGASDNKCLETYHGPEAFSEVEMRNIRDYFLDQKPTPILAMCLHSYSQLWMYPYGYKTGVFPENVREIVSRLFSLFRLNYMTYGALVGVINKATLAKNFSNKLAYILALPIDI